MCLVQLLLDYYHNHILTNLTKILTCSMLSLLKAMFMFKKKIADLEIILSTKNTQKPRPNKSR